MIDFIQHARVRIWLLLVGVFTLLIGTSYSLVQQSTRQAVNDLPLATAQTVSHELASGATAPDVVPAVKTDLSSDSTVFVTVTDNSQHILASSAVLSGQTPLPPAGAFSYTIAHGSDHFTWQPASNSRLAVEMLPYGSGANAGFIITGQSLQQAERRVSIYGEISLAGWLGMVAWTTLLLCWPSRPVIKLKTTPKKKKK